jgi:hypothetical protein
LTGHGEVSLVQLRSLVPPFAPRHDQVDESTQPQDPAIFHEDVPTAQENSVELSQEPLTGHGAFERLQFVASEPPFAPRQVQVDDHPQDPGRFAVVVPSVHPYWIVLLQEPFIGHGAFARVQLMSLVPPFAPRHDQVDDPPQDPATVPDAVPRAQANCVELSQEPLIGHGAFAILQLRSSDPPPAPRHDQVDDPPQDPAILLLVVPAEQANCVELSQEPLIEQGALAFEQVRSSDPPFAPIHDQVDDPPPQDPASVPDAVPVEQAN